MYYNRPNKIYSQQSVTMYQKKKKMVEKLCGWNVIIHALTCILI